MTREEYNKFMWEKNHKIIDGVIYRHCSVCKEWKVETEKLFYYKNKRQPDRGYQAACIICTRIDRNIYTANNLEIVLARNEKWKDENRDKNLGYMRDFYQDNKDERREYVKSWVNNNPERAKESCQQHRDHDITDNEWIANKDFFKNKNGQWCCAYCGLLAIEHFKTRNGITKVEELHKEHVDHYGANDVRNCVPSCLSCNSTKNIKSIEVLFKSGLIEKFTEERYNKVVQWITEEYKKYIEDKPPYRITRKQNKGLKTYHWELWTVSEGRDFLECIATADKKQGLKPFIKMYFSESA